MPGFFNEPNAAHNNCYVGNVDINTPSNLNISNALIFVRKELDKIDFDDFLENNHYSSYYGFSKLLSNLKSYLRINTGNGDIKSILDELIAGFSKEGVTEICKDKYDHIINRCNDFLRLISNYNEKKKEVFQEQVITSDRVDSVLIGGVMMS